MKKKTNNTDRVGMESGITIRVNSFSLLHPSVKAASMISRGKLPKVDAKRYVPNALWITVKTMMTT